MSLTPVERHDGLWLKLEERHRLPSGVNGSKLRACQYLIGAAKAAGKTRVISAASVLSPQNAMAANVAADLGMECTVILGGTKPSTAGRHRAVQIASDYGADFRYIPVGYNPALQRAARAEATDPAAYHLQYGITTPPDASAVELRAFHNVGADQVANLPAEVKTLVIPFGSGNTAAGVLLGLSQQPPEALERVILMGIGPDRQEWLWSRLAVLDAKVPVPVTHIALHPDFATYGDKMKASIGPITMHPTYEGKIVRWADENRPPWWTRRDGSTAMWIVGGPI
jgi:hypothetical protein